MKSNSIFIAIVTLITLCAGAGISTTCFGQSEAQDENTTESRSYQEEGIEQNATQTLVIAIKSNDKWVGFQAPNKLSSAKFDQESLCVIT